MKALHVIFTALAIVAHLIVFILWLLFMYGWQGPLGVVLGIVFVPGEVIFPFLAWAVTGEFPDFTFVVWLSAIALSILASRVGKRDS